MTGTYSSLKLITERIEFLKNKLELSNELREKAVELCKKIVEKNIPRCRSTDTMAAAIIYAICRESGVNHTLNDIVKITGLKKNSIAKYYRIIINNLNQKMPIFEIESGVNRITTNMKISDDVKEIALELVNFAKKRNHVAGKAFKISTELVASVVVGTTLGYILDNWFGTKPWLIICFFIHIFYFII